MISIKNIIKTVYHNFKSYSLLSVDVAWGGVISSMFLSHFTLTQSSVVANTILGLVIWSIYTFDHLLDVKKSKANQLSERLLFHRKHSRLLTKVLILTIIVIGILLPFIPSTTLLYGSILSCIVLIYFLSIHFLNSKFIVHKELIIAIIYTAGIGLGPISQMNEPFSKIQLLIIGIFFIIVLFNLLVFSLMDKKEDLSAKFPSFVMAAGEPITLIVLKSLGLLGVLLIICLMALGSLKETLLLTLMFGVLQLIFWKRDNVHIVKYYRYAGDGIFLFPIFYLF